VDSDLEAEYRLKIALHLPEEERAFKLPKLVRPSNSSEPSNSTDPSNALVLATQNPMSGNLVTSILICLEFFIPHKAYFAF
jgi:hypothetical protein